MVEETYARGDGDGLGVRGLGCVVSCFIVTAAAAVGGGGRIEFFEEAAVEVEGELDFGFVGVAGDFGGADALFGGHVEGVGLMVLVVVYEVMMIAGVYVSRRSSEIKKFDRQCSRLSE